MTNIRKQISIHAPKARKPQTTEQFGYFLAGLIDSAGHIDTLGYIRIMFYQNDVSLAYYIKKAVGYGSVKQINNKKAHVFICSHEGIQAISKLIHNKLKLTDNIQQFNNISKANGCLTRTYSCDNRVSVTNHWLAGFIQGSGAFQIKTVNHEQKIEVQVVLHIYQKSDYILKLIQSTFGGYVGITPQNTYYYSSVNFTNAVKLIDYLDHYQVMSSGLTIYTLWRKAYLRVQHNAHLTDRGLNDIIKFKRNMSKIRKTLN
jgi:LAGLIDADG endonuclease